MWKLWLNTHKTETILFSKRCSPSSGPYSNPVHPWALAIRFLGLVLDSKLLFTRHLYTVANKATGVFCNIFSHLSWDSVLSHSNKLTLYKILIQSILISTASVWSSTCSSSYLRSYSSKCLWVISNHLRCTPTSHLCNTVNIVPIPIIIHWLTAKFFAQCPSHLNPLVSQIGNYSPANLTNLQEI
jgi:hypothetical protein